MRRHSEEVKQAVLAFPKNKEATIVWARHFYAAPVTISSLTRKWRGVEFCDGGALKHDDRDGIPIFMSSL